MLSRENQLIGCSRSKPNQGGVLLDLTPAGVFRRVARVVGVEMG